MEAGIEVGITVSCFALEWGKGTGSPEKKRRSGERLVKMITARGASLDESMDYLIGQVQNFVGYGQTGGLTVFQVDPQKEFGVFDRNH